MPEVGAPAVDEGVKGRVGVSQPVEDSEEQLDVAQVQESHEDVEDKKRQPAQREGSHDDAQSFYSFMLFKTELKTLCGRVFPFPFLGPCSASPQLFTWIQSSCFLHVYFVLWLLILSSRPGFIHGGAVAGVVQLRGVVRVAEVPLPPPDLLQLLLSLLEDPAVEENHHHERQVEGHDGGGHSVRHVGVEVAALLAVQAALGFLVVGHPQFQVDGQEGDEEGDHPNPQDHRQGSTSGQQQRQEGAQGAGSKVRSG